MGECRTACCRGWPVGFSLEDYFRLSACDCSAELRHRIDTGIRVSLTPTPDRYAEIAPRFDGDCSMRLSDGRCAIHAELGEGALTDVCRLYPRGVRTSPFMEYAFSNSCEAVLEMLIDRDTPIGFIKERLDVQPPPQSKRVTVFNTLGKEQDIRLWLIKLVQRREYSFSHRLMLLGTAMQALEKVLKAADSATLDALLSQPYNVAPPAFDVGKAHLEQGLSVMEGFIAFLDSRSDSIRTYGEEALARFGEGDGCFERYTEAKLCFENRFPKWQIWFENMLVNHMFFEQFPFQDRPVSLWNEFVAVCAVYAVLRFICLGCAPADNSDFIDMCAAVFRLIDHTSFDVYSARALFGLGCRDPQKVFDLISL